MAETPSTTVIATRALKPRRTWVRVLLLIVNYTVPLVALWFIWQFVTSTWPSPMFPTPAAIWDNSMRLFFGIGTPSGFELRKSITVDMWGTLYRMLSGFGIGSAVGILIGLAIGRSMIVRGLTNPIVEFLRSIPATATLPLFLILLGANDGMRIAFVAFGVTWFVVINTAAGVSSVHITQIEMGQIFKLSRAAVLFRIVVPAAMPKIFAGLRIAVIGALLLSVVSEFMIAGSGMGYQLVFANSAGNRRDIWSWIAMLAVIGLILNLLLELIETTTLKWDRMAQRAG